MSEKQHQAKRRKMEHRSSSRRMEDELNKSAFRTSGAAGRPPHDFPHTTVADPYVPPLGDESHRVASARPQTSNETGHGATTVQPLVGDETGQVASTWIPPQEGIAAPVVHAPESPMFDRSQTDMRGAVPAGYEHGASYGGHLTTGLNSSLVDDDEAASRAEYIYQQQHVQRQASRTLAYGEASACPRPNVRSTSLRTSFDSREGESQSSHALERIEGIMARMEKHLAASTSAPATSSATQSAPFYSGEFHSFIFTLNC
jgi:hypothetical protein